MVTLQFTKEELRELQLALEHRLSALREVAMQARDLGLPHDEASYARRQLVSELLNKVTTARLSPPPAGSAGSVPSSVAASEPGVSP